MAQVRKPTRGPQGKQVDALPRAQPEVRLPEITIGQADGPSSAGWHKIQDFLACPKKYQYSQVRRIIVPTAETPDYFAVGILFAVARAHWFAKRFATDEKALTAIREQVRIAAEKNKLPIALRAEQKALRYFEEYSLYWSMRPKPQPIAAEYDIGPSRISPDHADTKVTYRTARLDDVSRYDEAGGKLCIGEAKTTSGSIKDCVNQYRLHGQTALQALLWKMAPQGEATHGPIAGIVLDVTQKGKEGEASKFSREFMPLNERVLKWYSRNLFYAVRAAASVTWDSEVPRNITSCTMMQGRARIACPYRELCMYGQSAAVSYTFEGGKALRDWKPDADEERTVPPWE